MDVIVYVQSPEMTAIVWNLLQIRSPKIWMLLKFRPKIWVLLEIWTKKGAPHPWYIIRAIRQAGEIIDREIVNRELWRGKLTLKYVIYIVAREVT